MSEFQFCWIDMVVLIIVVVIQIGILYAVIYLKTVKMRLERYNQELQRLLMREIVRGLDDDA